MPNDDMPLTRTERARITGEIMADATAALASMDMLPVLVVAILPEARHVPGQPNAAVFPLSGVDREVMARILRDILATMGPELELPKARREAPRGADIN